MDLWDYNQILLGDFVSLNMYIKKHKQLLCYKPEGTEYAMVLLTTHEQMSVS